MPLIPPVANVSRDIVNCIPSYAIIKRFRFEAGAVQFDHEGKCGTIDGMLPSELSQVLHGRQKGCLSLFIVRQVHGFGDDRSKSTNERDELFVGLSVRESYLR